MADPSGVGARLKAIRVDRGYSQQKVADLLGCHQSNVYHIESGKQSPSVVQLRKLAALYNCMMEELIEGELPLGRTMQEVAAPDEMVGSPIRVLKYADQVPPFGPHPVTRHVTREITRREIEAALDRREAIEAVETMQRLGIELTPEQRAALIEKTSAA